MTKTVVKNALYTAQAEIPLVFVRYLEGRTNERVLEVVLVYSGVDRFDTIIEPRGMKTDPKVVVVDYNHKGVSTGAYLRNVRVEKNYKIENGEVLEEALVGEIHVPQDAEMFYHTREGEKKSNGNLHEAVTKGQVQSVSVEFRPYKGKQRTDIKTGITTFEEWDLIRLSLLDVAPGQPYSGIKITRSLIIDNNNMQRYLNTLVKYNNKFGIISKELEETDSTTQTVAYLDGSGEEEVTFSNNEETNRPKYADIGEYLLSQVKNEANEDKSEEQDSQENDTQRDILITKGTNPAGDPATPPAADNKPANAEEAPVEDEMRKTISELSNRVASLEDTIKKMAGVSEEAGDQPETTRSIPIRVDDVPEKKQSRGGSEVIERHQLAEPASDSSEKQSLEDEQTRQWQQEYRLSNKGTR